MVCDRWRDFRNFLEDMGHPPDGLSLERRDNDKGYSKDNCYWATRAQQARNTRRNRFFTVRGVRMCVADISLACGVSHAVLSYRLKLGMPIEEAIKKLDRRRKTTT